MRRALNVILVFALALAGALVAPAATSQDRPAAGFCCDGPAREGARGCGCGDALVCCAPDAPAPARDERGVPPPDVPRSDVLGALVAPSGRAAADLLPAGAPEGRISAEAGFAVSREGLRRHLLLSVLRD